MSQYCLDFEPLARTSGYAPITIGDYFYGGLPNRIKNVMGNQIAPRPTDLTRLRAWALAIDANQWATGIVKRKSDSSSTPRDSHNSSKDKTSSNKRAKTSGSNTHSSAASTKTTTTTTKTTSGNASSSSKSATPDLTGKLNASGKLTEDERQRRIREGLCLYCGKPGHEAKDCRKAAHNREVKARKATSTPATSAGSSAPAASLAPKSEN